MERLLTVKDVAGIMQVSRRTAYGYMAQMIHMADPLRVTEASLRDWMRSRTVDPAEKLRNVKSRPAARREMPGIADHRIPKR